PLSTSATPGTSRARAVSTRTMRPCGTGLRNSRACSMPGNSKLIVYEIRPATRCAPSIMPENCAGRCFAVVMAAFGRVGSRAEPGTVRRQTHQRNGAQARPVLGRAGDVFLVHAARARRRYRHAHAGDDFARSERGLVETCDEIFYWNRARPGRSRGRDFGIE